jgi:hypothetical protein
MSDNSRSSYFFISSAQLWLINSTVIIQFFVHRGFLVLFCCKKGNLCLVLFYRLFPALYFSFAPAVAKRIQPGPETDTLSETSGPARLPAQVAGRGTHKLKKCTVRKKIFRTGNWADQSGQGRTKVSCTGTAGPTNQPRKDQFHLYSLSPHSPQFQPERRGFNS